MFPNGVDGDTGESDEHLAMEHIYNVIHRVWFGGSSKKSYSSGGGNQYGWEGFVDTVCM